MWYDQKLEKLNCSRTRRFRFNWVKGPRLIRSLKVKQARRPKPRVSKPNEQEDQEEWAKIPRSRASKLNK
jgi:hypothetical protein